MRQLWTVSLERVVLVAVGLVALLVAGAFLVAFVTVPGRASGAAAALAFLVLVAAGLYAWRRETSGPAP